jgi:hypothetical protein
VETLDRELHAICEEAARTGGPVGHRLDAILELLPVIGATARHPTHAADRAAVEAMLTGMRERCDALDRELRTRLAAVGAELAQLRAGRTAAAGYAFPAVQDRTPQLDLVG